MWQEYKKGSRASLGPFFISGLHWSRPGGEAEEDGAPEVKSN